jgi:hypothetical protein
MKKHLKFTKELQMRDLLHNPLDKIEVGVYAIDSNWSLNSALKCNFLKL